MPVMEYPTKPILCKGKDCHNYTSEHATAKGSFKLWCEHCSQRCKAKHAELGAALSKPDGLKRVVNIDDDDLDDVSECILTQLLHDNIKAMDDLRADTSVIAISLKKRRLNLDKYIIQK